MKLVVVIPVLDEEKTLGGVIGRMPQDIPGVTDCEVIVVDDGSSDGSAEIARQAGARVISHGANLGVGRAFQTGVEAALEAGADLVVNIDGDGQFAPEDIPKLLEPILQGQAEFVTCTRFGDPDLVPEMGRMRRWGNRMMTRLINWITRERLTDVSCGFRAYNRKAAMRLNLFGHFTYTQESFIDMAGKGIRMAEVPLKVRGTRRHGRSRVADSLWRYGLRAGSILLRAARDSRPLAIFGGIGLAVLLLGVACGVFVLVWWMVHGMTYPFRSVLTGSAAFLMLGFLLLVLALIADMLGRMRRTQEDILYMMRLRHYDRAAANSAEATGGDRRPDPDASSQA